MRLSGWFKGRRWWLLLLAAAGGALVAAAVSIALPTQYRAESTLALTGASATRELQLTYAQMLTSEAYLEEVAPGLGLTSAELARGLRAVPAPGTVLVGVFVTNGKEHDAINRANAVADGFSAFLAETGVTEADSVVVTQRATSAEQISNTTANALLGGAVAFLVAAAILTFARPRESEEPRPATGLSGRDDYESVDLA